MSNLDLDALRERARLTEEERRVAVIAHQKTHKREMYMGIPPCCQRVEADAATEKAIRVVLEEVLPSLREMTTYAENLEGGAVSEYGELEGEEKNAWESALKNARALLALASGAQREKP